MGLFVHRLDGPLQAVIVPRVLKPFQPESHGFAEEIVL